MFDFKRLPVPILRDLFGASVPAVWYRAIDAAVVAVVAVVAVASESLHTVGSDELCSQLKHGVVHVLIASTGMQVWRLNGYLHRDNGLPSIVGGMGYRTWYVNERLHRDGDLPAIESANGSKKWYQNGKRHRDNDQPAMILTHNKTKIERRWYQNDVLHREFDRPAYEEVDRNGHVLIQRWYVHGKRHRDNGLPAEVTDSGEKQWWVDGRRRRDGTMVVIPFKRNWNGCILHQTDLQVTIKLPVVVAADGALLFLNSSGKLVRKTYGKDSSGASVPIVNLGRGYWIEN